MKKDYKALSKVMEKCSDKELVFYRTAISMGVVNFESIETGEMNEEYNLEVFDCITMELVYRGVM